ncbi:MAG: hypothetical protein HC930_10270 [Hydrococcus sp. SU_1_0]|nr:hypothetical protein [Hydrococcus sp. SU_1_0]
MGKKLSGIGITIDNEISCLEIMILEIAVLNIKPGMNQQYEAAFAKASPLISSMNGYISHDLQNV